MHGDSSICAPYCASPAPFDQRSSVPYANRVTGACDACSHEAAQPENGCYLRINPKAAAGVDVRQERSIFTDVSCDVIASINKGLEQSAPIATICFTARRWHSSSSFQVEALRRIRERLSTAWTPASEMYTSWNQVDRC